MAKQNKAKCPDCGEIVEIDSYNEIGDVITCQNCDIELEIAEINPPKLKIHKGFDDKDEEEQEDEDQLDNFDEEDQFDWNE